MRDRLCAGSDLMRDFGVSVEFLTQRGALLLAVPNRCGQKGLLRDGSFEKSGNLGRFEI